jgi:ankyrin repeat protein
MNAIKYKHWTIVEYLLKDTDATIDGALPQDEEIDDAWLLGITKITKRYLTAAKTNDWNTMLECLEGPGRDIIKKGIDHKSRTAAQIAARHGYLNIVTNIVERHFMGPSYNDDLYRVATIAATYGHLDVVKYIFERNDFVYTTFSFSMFPRINYIVRPQIAIFGAVTNGHLDVVKFLCKYVPKDVLNFVVMDCTQIKILQFFHEEKIINVRSDLGMYDLRTYLSRAAQKGHLRVVEWLTKTMKVDARVSNDDGTTVLMDAFDEDTSHGSGDRDKPKYKPKSLETAFWLMKNCGVKIDDIVDEDTGRTALMVACEKLLFPVVENILKHTKVDLTALDNTGKSVWNMVDWRGNDYNSYVKERLEIIMKIMIIECEHIPDTFLGEYEDSRFQAFVEKGQILREQIESYEKERKTALKLKLSTRTKKKPDGVVCKVVIENILSFDKLTFDEKWSFKKRRFEEEE